MSVVFFVLAGLSLAYFVTNLVLVVGLLQSGKARSVEVSMIPLLLAAILFIVGWFVR